MFFLAAPARADDADPGETPPRPVGDVDIIGDDPGWRIEHVQLRMELLDQRGRGFQSQAGPAMGPGSEQMWVLRPAALIDIRQSKRVSHEVTVPVDVISAASPDAVDATSSASRHNESVDVDLRSTYRHTEADAFSLRLAGHVEEQLKSRLVGAGYRRSLADDNASVALTGSVGYDGFDDVDHTGTYLGAAGRWIYNVNIAVSQLLSPTTVADASYGVTQQVGKLSSGWGGVPTPGGVVDEKLPTARLRQALAVRLAQHIPSTRTTGKLWYRLYLDNFGVTAHTIEANAYQYVARRIYVRGGYRFHHQNGVGFFTTMFAGAPFDNTTLRTADSDLAPFAAHECSLQLVTLGKPGSWALSGELLRYWRTNDLRITTVSVGLTKAL